eukprot:3948852-Amphidinium_carterae.1
MRGRSEHVEGICHNLALQSNPNQLGAMCPPRSCSGHPAGSVRPPQVKFEDHLYGLLGANRDLPNALIDDIVHCNSTVLQAQQRGSALNQVPGVRCFEHQFYHSEPLRRHARSQKLRPAIAREEQDRVGSQFLVAKERRQKR